VGRRRFAGPSPFEALASLGHLRVTGLLAAGYGQRRYAA
jgi:hypothetical protein